MQPVLITGGTGFVGRGVVDALVKSRQHLRVLVRSSSNVPAHWSNYSAIEIIFCDEPFTADALIHAFDGVSRVVHLAGLAHVAGSETSFSQVNAELTARICDQAQRVGVSHFIHLSSLAAITPNSTVHPIDDSIIAEPETPYGRSKRQAEHHVQHVLGRVAMAVSLRPPLVIGAEASGNWALLQRIAATRLWLPFASIRSPRNFISRETLVEAILQLLKAKPRSEASGDYCIADRQEVELNQIVRWLRRGMGQPQRMFSFPRTLLMTGGRILRRERQFSGLLGRLQVNDERFRKTFSFTYQSDLQNVIERSGRAFVAARSNS